MRLPAQEWEDMSISICAQAPACELETLAIVHTDSQLSTLCEEETAGEPVFQTIPTIVIHPPAEAICELEVGRQNTFDNRDAPSADDASTICITGSRNIVVSQAAHVQECERKYSFDYWDA